jgi:hypothetical protein
MAKSGTESEKLAGCNDIAVVTTNPLQHGTHIEPHLCQTTRHPVNAGFV